MISIRLTRLGARKKPFYRIVVTDSRRPRESRAKDIIGYYNPLLDPPEIKIDKEKADYWVSQGAQVSETVQSLLHKASKSEKQSN